jgi:hypothetical protein
MKGYSKNKGGLFEVYFSHKKGVLIEKNKLMEERPPDRRAESP